MDNRRWLAFGFLTLLATPCAAICQDISRILASHYEYRMISSGVNRPGVDLREDHLGEICVLFHYGIPTREICKQFMWSEQELQQRIDILLKEELLKRDNAGKYLPAMMVITADQGKKIVDGESVLVEQVTQIITRRLPIIREMYDQIEAFQAVPFSEASLFVLSDVLLDNWQINNVERRFLKSERTPRKGMHYYYAILETDADASTEAFGIYGNSVGFEGNVGVGLYGNQRNQLNLESIAPPQLRTLFGMQESADPRAFWRDLIGELVTLSHDIGAELNPEHRTGF